MIASLLREKAIVQLYCNATGGVPPIFPPPLDVPIGVTPFESPLVAVPTGPVPPPEAPPVQAPPVTQAVAVGAEPVAVLPEDNPPVLWVGCVPATADGPVTGSAG